MEEEEEEFAQLIQEWYDLRSYLFSSKHIFIHSDDIPDVNHFDNLFTRRTMQKLFLKKPQQIREVLIYKHQTGRWEYESKKKLLTLYLSPFHIILHHSNSYDLRCKSTIFVEYIVNNLVSIINRKSKIMIQIREVCRYR